MQNLKKRFLLVVILLLILSSGIYAKQDSLLSVKKLPNYVQIKNYYEEIINHSSDKDGEGNEWVQRWIYNNKNKADMKGDFEYLKPGYEAFTTNRRQKSNDKLLGQNSWVPVGPFNKPLSYEPRSCYNLGRINCVAFHPTNKDIFWIGTPGGGVWKTENGGKSWVPQSDNLPTLEIGSIAVDPVNPDNVYIGTGDFDGGGLNSINALGVFKSTDGGSSWKQTALNQDSSFNYSFIKRILINPLNPKEIIAAGSLGIWKTKNAGDSWYFVGDSVITDMQADPHNPKVVYGAMGCYYYQIGNAGIIKSTDFGETWTLLKTGILPKNQVSRIAIAVSPADSNYLYALCVYGSTSNYHKYGGLSSFYQSTDAGASWTRTADYNQSPNILGSWNGDSLDQSGQGTYDLAIICDNKDKHKVYTGGVNIWMTTDGGTSWDMASFWIYSFGESIHADHHYAAYNALDSKYYWCNDGGIYRTKEINPGSKDWISDWIDREKEDAKPGHPDFKFPTVWENLTDGLLITEFYRIGISKNKANLVTGGAQDNSCFLMNDDNWVNYIANYDGMSTMVDYSDPNTIYGVWQNGGLCKSTDGGKTIKVRLADTIINKFEEVGNWITPVAMDPVNPNKIYIGFRNLWRSDEGGKNWRRVLNLDSIVDVTNNHAPIIFLNTAYSDTNYIAVCKNAVYFQDSLGNYSLLPSELWITKDGGEHWTRALAGLPQVNAVYQRLDYDKYNPEKMWMVTNHTDETGNTFRSTDGGLSWTNIPRKLPDGISLNCVVHQSGIPGEIMYAGTNKGIYYTDSTMDSWEPYGENLPLTSVTDIQIQYLTGELYAATYGRGIWRTPVKSRNLNNLTNVRLYPNPSNGNFTVDLSGSDLTGGEKVHIKIFDITGAEAIELSAFNSKTDPIAIKSNLSLGVYFIQIESGNKKYIEKFNIVR